ncbi:hypothetical protein SLEP1_g46556 [Rubroshorea leprosula]|uniref:CBS domain-containing protein n=1 Tax=Rubroshorea leprosula TaxID=152421 RepID=A0AAV5LQB4_9ROSI|nr:hypothetical protein SLEP1_g46556 [Rubroshorea leprosula]
MLSKPLCLLFFFLCLKTAFSSSIHASSFSTTHLCSHEEALALLQFKTSFSINYTIPYPYDPDYCVDNFYTKPNYSKIESWKEGIDCCSWDGVSCDNVTGHVIALNLSCSFLDGTFPSNSTLFFLRNLQSLNLALNDFRLSKIPPEISQFTRLKHLDISYSRFSSHVPGEIAHLPKLVSLNLSGYLYDDPPELILETTTFRNLVHNLSEVRELVLEGVNMTSVNPRFFMNLSSSLTTLNLWGWGWETGLRGNFPNSIFRFPNLKFFYLGGEGNLTIDLPSSNWSSPLQELYLNVMDCGRRLLESIGDLKSLQSLSLGRNLEVSEILLKRGVFIGAMLCCLLVFACKRVLVVEEVLNAGYGVIEQWALLLRNAWPKVSMVLKIFKEQGVILTALLRLSAFFLWQRLLLMAETSIILDSKVHAAVLLLSCLVWRMMLVHELAEKESEDGVFQMLHSDVTWFLTTILIGTKLVNIGAIALVTDAATAIFGEAGVSAATAIFDYELKLMLRGAELSGAIKKEEQDMIENVLEIKDTHVREVMTPLVDVVAIDASATLVDFHHRRVTHQYSRVPSFEQHVDNIVGIVYTMDLLDFVQKGEQPEGSSVGDIAHKPAYFVPEALAHNIGIRFNMIVTLEDVVEEIVGEIFDENDSKEEIQKKTGYIAMRAEGVYDVDANTSI